MARQAHQAMAAMGSQSQALSLPPLPLASEEPPSMPEAPVLPGPELSPPSPGLLPAQVRCPRV